MSKFSLETEENRCIDCNKYFTYSEAYFQNWKCSDCFNRLILKINIEGRSQSCSIYKPNEIRTDELILENRTIYPILNITSSGNRFEIALKGYGRVKKNINDDIVVVNGSWYY